MKRIGLLFILTLYSAGRLFAQLVDASPEITNLCTGGSATLTATVTLPGTGGAPGSLPTDSYAISNIPYAPDPLNVGTAVALSDDNQSALIPIGFNFCFFGATYSQFIIGSNNWIGFQAGETSTWVTAAIPNPSGAIAPRNTIMAPWQDINPGAGGTVKYQLYGTAPNRRLSISWNNVPMFSCTGQLYSSQIIIYETSNIIETHILNKSLCTTWNSGNAVHGLQNATGTVAFVVPGRNNTQWTASNEGTRFTPNGAATYTINWYILPANTLIGTGSSISVTPPASPQYYYAEVVGPNGCGPGAPNTDTVVVNSINQVVDAGPYSPICQGSSTTLNPVAPGATIYSWSPATGLSNPSIANPVASPAATTTYTLTATTALGCTGTDTVTIGVNPSPLTDAGFGSGLCRGDNIQLAGNGSAGTYSWSPGATLDDSTILTPTATPVSTTTYTLTITNAIGCSGSDTATVFILNPVADAGPNTSICAGNSTTLTASGGDTYDWTPGTGLSDSTIASPVANPAITTTYTVIVSSSSTGCSATDSVTITVNPAIVANAGNDTSICFGNNTTLGASGGVSYAWTPTTSLSNSTISNPVASPATTTTYTVIVTGASGCVSSDSVKIIVNPLPVVNAGSDVSICVGASALLNASGALNYYWTPGATLNNDSIANPVASPAASTSYVVTGTDINGCSDTDTINVSLNGLVITPSPNTAICAGSSTTLNVTGALSYIWSPSATLNNDTIANPVATPMGNTTYTVIGTSSNGCSDTAFVTVSINSLPPVNAGTSLSTCSGANANLSVTGANTYVWSPASSLNNAFIPTPVASPTGTTLYTVTGTDLNGCSNTDTVTVVVHPIPAANAGPNTSICIGSPTTLNASGGGTYSWTPSTGLSSSTIANPVANPAVTTTYTVTVMGAGFCTATSQVTVTVNSLPVASAGPDASICNGASTVLNAGGGASYFWSPSSGLSSSTSPNPTATPSSTTQYVVTVSNAAGCTDKDTVVVNVSNALTMAPASVTDETCSNNNGAITVVPPVGGSAPYSYSLNGGPTQSTLTFPSLTQGTYTVTVADAMGCSSSQVVSVGQVVNVNAAFTADPQSGPKPLNVNFTNNSTGATSYIWDLGNGITSMATDPSTIYTSTGTYTVTLIASNGGYPCIDTATFTIDVFEESMVLIPNIFTPNGDGKNDIFMLQSTGVSEVNGMIFNRWGKKIYDWSGNANSGWDGRINGGTAQDGTYYYIIRIKTTDGKEKEEKGYVQLLSN